MEDHMMHESELKLNSLYNTPYRRGAWTRTVRYIGKNAKGTKFYFDYPDYPDVPAIAVGQRSVRTLRPSSRDASEQSGAFALVPEGQN